MTIAKKLNHVVSVSDNSSTIDMIHTLSNINQNDVTGSVCTYISSLQYSSFYDCSNHENEDNHSCNDDNNKNFDNK